LDTGSAHIRIGVAGSAESRLDGFEAPGFAELLRATPTMPTTVIAERLGWPYFDPGVESRVGGVAAGVPAAGSGVADGVSGRGDRAVRLLVTRHRAAGWLRTEPTATRLPVLTMVGGHSSKVADRWWSVTQRSPLGLKAWGHQALRRETRGHSVDALVQNVENLFPPRPCVRRRSDARCVFDSLVEGEPDDGESHMSA